MLAFQLASKLERPQWQQLELTGQIMAHTVILNDADARTKSFQGKLADLICGVTTNPRRTQKPLIKDR